IQPGSTVQLTARLYDDGGHRLKDRVGTWRTSNANIATVSTHGLVTGVAKGSAYITAESEGRSSTAAVTVGPRAAASITISLGTSTLIVGHQTQATAIVRDASGAIIPSTELVVAWQSGNPALATVTAAGIVTGIAEGNTSINAIAGGKTASVPLSVQKRTATSIAILPANPSVFLGNQLQLAAEVRD